MPQRGSQYRRAMRVVTNSKVLEAEAATRGRLHALHAFIKAQAGKPCGLAELAAALHFGEFMDAALAFMNALADDGAIWPGEWRAAATVKLPDKYDPVFVALPAGSDLLGAKVLKEQAPTTELIKYFDLRHRRRFNESPAVIYHGKDAQLLAALWRNRQHDTLEIRRLMDAFFETLDPFIAQAGYSIGVFVKQVPKLLARAQVAADGGGLGRDLSRGRLGVKPGQFR